jgi:glycosyltransferase involved in cell wall biosynthesis
MQPIYPLISVVLCTYNGEKYVAEQVASILAQTYSNLEIIICDDASTDNTFSILEKYAASDVRIRLYRNEKNVGYNKNFEQALSLANAEWIAIADQDDIWLPHKIKSLYNAVTPGTLLVHSYNAEFKNDDLSITFINRSRVRFKGNNTRELLFYNTVSGHAMMLHKKLLSIALPFPDGVYYDWWLGLNASIQGSIQLHDEALVLHRQHSSNSSHINSNIAEKHTKENFFKEKIATLESFTQLKGLNEEDKGFLKMYIQLLKTEWQKKFSFLVFFFFLKHAQSAFYFRKKLPMVFYYVKYSFKRATLKVKHWT